MQKMQEVKGKGKRGLLRLVFGRTTFFLLFLGIQIAVLCGLYLWLDAKYQAYGYAAFAAVGAILAIRILNEDQNASFKMAWIVVVLLFPVFGGLFYVFVQLQMETKRLAKRIADVRNRTDDFLPQNELVYQELKEKDAGEANLIRYLYERGGYPVYENTEYQYFSVGEQFYENLLEELKKAEKFIFLEYFIIHPGFLWDNLLKILEEKAAAGIEVRVLYDGMNDFSNVPHDYPKILEEKHIECRVFNPIRPAISTSQNNRDHRKIFVIDGKVGYTGGVNLADEYINKKVRFGHWKDNAVCLRGDAVKSLTIMFLQMWNVCGRKPDYLCDYGKYAEAAEKTCPCNTDHSGFSVPFSDSPLDNEPVGHQLYLDILYQAKDYVYMMSPYLILDDDMRTALCYAAKRGVETVLIMPHIPDKRYAYQLAHTYCPELIRAGVKVYEYLPGFVHAKTFVSDDKKAVVGTINMDFRSQYLNFENGVYIYGNPVVMDIKEDFEATLGKCARMTEETYDALPFWHRFLGQALRLIAPLM